MKISHETVQSPEQGPPCAYKRRAASKGSALILALWSLSILCVFAASLGYGVRQKLTLLSRLQRTVALEAIARSGAEKAKAVLKPDAPPEFSAYTDPWANSPADFREIAMAGGFLTVGYASKDALGQPVTWYGLVDEERKLNVNKAESAAILRLLQSVGLDKDAAEAAAYAIADWRDGDSNLSHPDLGAEKDYYDDLREPYAIKDAPFETIDELLLVKGINRDIFDKIKPFVTIYGEGQVNVNTAPKEVLMALGLEDRTAGKILLWRQGPDGIEGTADDRIFTQAQMIFPQLQRSVPPLDGVESVTVQNLVDQGRLGVLSSYFTVHSRAALKGAGEMRMETVIDRMGKTYYSRITGTQWTSQA